MQEGALSGKLLGADFSGPPGITVHRLLLVMSPTCSSVCLSVRPLVSLSRTGFSLKNRNWKVMYSYSWRVSAACSRKGKR